MSRAARSMIHARNKCGNHETLWAAEFNLPLISRTCQQYALRTHPLRSFIINSLRDRPKSQQEPASGDSNLAPSRIGNPRRNSAALNRREPGRCKAVSRSAPLPHATSRPGSLTAST